MPEQPPRPIPRDPRPVVPDPRPAAQTHRLDPRQEAEALRWIEAVSDFDAPAPGPA